MQCSQLTGRRIRQKNGVTKTDIFGDKAIEYSVRTEPVHDLQKCCRDLLKRRKERDPKLFVNASENTAVVLTRRRGDKRGCRS